MQKVEQLKRHFPQPGKVEWIGIRPGKGLLVEELEAVEARKDRGLEGDKAGQRPGGKRQVTLIQFEYLPLVQSLLPDSEFDIAGLRRNLGVSGINLNALKDQRIQIGDAILQVTGFCHPCGKIEQQLGYGVFNALRGHGGLTAKVEGSGRIAIGDSVQVVYPT